MSKVVNLSLLKTKTKARVLGVKNLETSLHKRLIELGILQGEKIEVLKNSKNNLLLIGTRGYSLSIDCRIAEKISVEVL